MRTSVIAALVIATIQCISIKNAAPSQGIIIPLIRTKTSDRFEVFPGWQYVGCYKQKYPWALAYGHLVKSVAECSENNQMMDVIGVFQATHGSVCMSDYARFQTFEYYDKWSGDRNFDKWKKAPEDQCENKMGTNNTMMVYIKKNARLGFEYDTREKWWKYDGCYNLEYLDKSYGFHFVAFAANSECRKIAESVGFKSYAVDYTNAIAAECYIGRGNEGFPDNYSNTPLNDQKNGQCGIASGSKKWNIYHFRK